MGWCLFVVPTRNRSRITIRSFPDSSLWVNFSTISMMCLDKVASIMIIGSSVPSGPNGSFISPFPL